MNNIERYTLSFKACYDAIKYVNTVAQTTNQLYASLLDKFNRYVVISDEVDGRQSQYVSISTTFGTIDPTDTNVKEFTFNNGSVLRYNRILPFDHTDGLEVVNYQTLINMISDSMTLVSGPAGPPGPKGDPGVTGATGAAGTNGNSRGLIDFTTLVTDGVSTITTIIAPSDSTWLTIINATTIKFNEVGTYEIFGYSTFTMSPYDHMLTTQGESVPASTTYNIPYPAIFTYSGSTVYSSIPFNVTLATISNNMLLPSVSTQLSIKKLV